MNEGRKEGMMLTSVVSSYIHKTGKKFEFFVKYLTQAFPRGISAQVNVDINNKSTSRDVDQYASGSPTACTKEKNRIKQHIPVNHSKPFLIHIAVKHPPCR